MKNRREFLGSVAKAALAATVRTPRLSGEALPEIIVQAKDAAFVRMPEDFTGLSYETPQLYNSDFFSAENSQLVKVFRGLSAKGILRLGGNLSDMARWKSDRGDFSTAKQDAAIEHGKTYWEWKLTDTSVRENRNGAITPEAIKHLRSFLDATGWRLIYGLNFGSGTPERAADEAACVAKEIGDRLVAFQVGNESDFFGGNRWFRDRSYDFETYFAGYNEFVDAVRKQVSHAPFAGPDTANNMKWVGQFAKRAEKPIQMLSSHYYAMGPAKDSAMNAERLLAANPRLGKQIEEARQATADSGGVPFRMMEGNSCFGGGKPDVSDSYASALWGADYMLRVASGGYCGVNLHGGGDGIYTPIETLNATVATPRPLYYGMQFADRFAGKEVAACTCGDAANVTAYASRSKGLVQVGLINKGYQPVNARLGIGLPRKRPTKEWRLTGASLDAKQGISLASAKPASSEVYTVAPYSATLFVWD